jgi:hypothetical protein
MKYSKELLEAILAEGSAVILGEYDRYNQRMRVNFKCSCGSETSKRFEMLNVYRLPYCEPCSLKKATDRSKATIMKKYGVENPGQSESIKKKIQNAWSTKYGGHPKTNKDVQEKWSATCLEKYGGHHNQNKEVQAKSEATSYHYKTYMMPSGNLVKYQGYEDKALDELVQLYEEEDICIGRANIPSIDYHIDDKKHVYFPDFYIKSLNKIIEVKSEWTIKLRRGNVEEKALATIKTGYKYEIWIYSDKKVKVETKLYG